jgi:hypothetical protein
MPSYVNAYPPPVNSTMLRWRACGLPSTPVQDLAIGKHIYIAIIGIIRRFVWITPLAPVHLGSAATFIAGLAFEPGRTDTDRDLSSSAIG